MKSVTATELKNRLGEVLEQAALGPVAVVRHGRVVAWVVPATAESQSPPRKPGRWLRRNEERVVKLCAEGDFRPSRWARAGDCRVMAGVAAMLASAEGFDRPRMLALAERLSPGMSTPEGLGAWLESAPVHAARLFPQVRAGMGKQ